MDEYIKDFLEDVKNIENFDVVFSEDLEKLDERTLFDKQNKIILICVKNLQKESVGYILADCEDFQKLSKLNFHIRYDKNSIKSFGSTSISKSLGFLILEITEKKDKEGKDIIFENFNKMDIRKENIKMVSKSQAIKYRNTNKRDLYKGVYNRTKGYRVYINKDGKQIFIGNFTDKIEAGKAYDTYSVFYFKENSIDNNLLTKDERNYIIENGLPEKYKKKKERELPVNIYKNKRGKGYYYNFKKEGRTYQKTFNSIEEAVNGKKLRLEKIEKEKNDKIQEIEDFEMEEIENDNLEIKNYKKKEDKNIPDILTIDFINNIKHVNLFKKLIKRENWGGKNNYFNISKINQTNLKDCKEKAIKIISGENVTKLEIIKKPVENEPKLFELLTQNKENLIETNKKHIIDKENNIVKVYLKNSKNLFLDYAKISINDYDIISKYSFHLKIDKYDKKTVICGNLNKPLIYMLYDKTGNSIASYKDSDSLNLTRENIEFLSKSDYTHYKNKKDYNYSSKYKGVCENNNGIYRSTISFEGKYIYIGSFKTELEAGKVYDIYSVHYYKRKKTINNLLSEKEIEDILKNGIPEKYKKRDEISENIYINEKGNYYYEIYLYRKRYTEDFPSLEEAIKAKNFKISEIKENYEMIKYEEEKNIKIERNKDSIPVFYACDKEGITYEITVSENTWKEINRYKLHIRDGYVFTYIDNKNIALHIYLYKKYVGNIDKNTSIDHININPLDNRLENLRLATFSLQNHNRNKNKNSIIKNIKGVTINGNKFVVNPYRKRFSFDYLEDASEKFNELAKEKYGDDAKLNPSMKTEKTKVIDTINIDDIDEEYIKNITHVELFKLVVKKKKWGGQKGKIHQSKVRANTLEDYKQIAINLIRKELK